MCCYVSTLFSHSLSWQEQQPKVLDGCTSDMMALCAGTTNGTVHLWTVQFEAGRYYCLTFFSIYPL